MKKIIVGSCLLTFLMLQPLIGYSLFNWLSIPEGVQIACTFAWSVTFVLQIMFIGALINAGYKELKVETPFS